MNDEAIRRMWRAADANTANTAPTDGAAGDEDLALLSLAARAMIDLNIDVAARALAGLAVSLAPPLADVRDLLTFLVAGRQVASDAAVDGARALVGRLDDRSPTKARALHGLGSMLNRRGRLDEAEEAFLAAIAHLDTHKDDDSPLFRARLVDSFANLMLGRGSFEEARVLLEALVERRAAAGDRFGAALSSSHLGRLHVARGRPGRARDVVAPFILDGPPGQLRLRLLSVRVAALLDDDDADAARVHLQELLALLESTSGRTGTRTHAAILCARLVGGGDAQETARLLKSAGDIDGGSEPLLVEYWRARLDPRGLGDDAQVARLSALINDVDVPPTESELRLVLLLADRAAATGDRKSMRAHLDRAFERAAQSTQPELLAIVEETFAALDPLGLVERSQERYSGRRRDELNKTTVEEVTLVFADMVGFSNMSTRVGPDVVMSTVRGLFEHAAPLLVRWRVRPIQQMGDGLLAVAQGDDHELRGLSFAREFVQRIGRAGLARRAFGEGWAPQLRAGVASGAVVLGLLGSSKLEYLAIGRPTNLAARLQGEAKPGEVVAAIETARAAGIAGVDESARLKGWDEPVPFRRIAVAL